MDSSKNNRIQEEFGFNPNQKKTDLLELSIRNLFMSNLY